MCQGIGLFAETQVIETCRGVSVHLRRKYMADGPIIERIDPELEELVDYFFKNSNEDLKKMQAALESRDYETLIRLGHTAKGTGYGYGFRGMGDIGMELEEAAKARNETEVRLQVEKMSHYFDNVQVDYGE